MTHFDARRYWEQRLADDYSLNGVGFKRLGPSFNEWAYRVRGARFSQVVLACGLDLLTAEVLDVGSGTGFYIDAWEALGVRAVTGVDITETAVARLAQTYPGRRFEVADIGVDAGSLPAAAYDAASAMDVLFHIVDDAAYARALAHIHASLKPGGVFVFSDAFVHGPAVRVAHQVSRPLADVERAVRDAGFEIERREPLFVLMNNPVDEPRRWARMAWYAAAGVVSLSDRLGGWVGRRLYPVELRLTASRAESPTTEIMVCRKRPG